jgi:acetolactate synthase regulatory subunit
VQRTDQKARAEWWRIIDQWRARDCLRYDRSRRDLIKPQYAIERLYALTRDRDVYITTEVGQHQMWGAQFFKFDEPYHWMTSGGLGTMGYGLPAAIGVQVAHPEALVIDIAGEASILMNIQEMSTAAQYRLPVKVFILNNQYMGMVRQWQELLHGGGRYSESYTAALPDFVKLAEAFGAVGMRVERPAELDAAIEEMLAVDRAVILDVAVDQTENCFPMIPSGAAHNEMLLGPRTRPRNRSPRRAWSSFDGTSMADLERHAIAVLVDNEPGILARVVGLFSGRGYNIESLTVAEVDRANKLSRITIMTSGTRMIIEQIKAQLSRLVPVHKVHEPDRRGAVCRARDGADQDRRQRRDAHRVAVPRRHFPRERRRFDDRELCLRADRVERQTQRLHRPDGAAPPRRSLPHGCRRNLARHGELLTAPKFSRRT